MSGSQHMSSELGEVPYKYRTPIDSPFESFLLLMCAFLVELFLLFCCHIWVKMNIKELLLQWLIEAFIKLNLSHILMVICLIIHLKLASFRCLYWTLSSFTTVTPDSNEIQRMDSGAVLTCMFTGIFLEPQETDSDGGVGVEPDQFPVNEQNNFYFRS